MGDRVCGGSQCLSRDRSFSTSESKQNETGAKNEARAENECKNDTVVVVVACFWIDSDVLIARWEIARWAIVFVSGSLFQYF
jgi:hypothetical protein